MVAARAQRHATARKRLIVMIWFSRSGFEEGSSAVKCRRELYECCLRALVARIGLQLIASRHEDPLRGGSDALRKGIGHLFCIAQEMLEFTDPRNVDVLRDEIGRSMLVEVEKFRTGGLLLLFLVRHHLVRETVIDGLLAAKPCLRLQ